MQPPDEVIEAAVRRALEEDLGAAGDVTTDAVVPPGAQVRARLVSRTGCVISGLRVFEACFSAMDPAVKVRAVAEDGAEIPPGTAVAELEGPAGPILTAERTALNFVQRMSGIATLTRRFVEAAPGVEIRDTRKTAPGLRVLDKYAVACGGGTNHRVGLSDAILIKDNHVAIAGGVRAAIELARASHPDLPVEVECDDLEHVREALEAGADEILLDNMAPEILEQAAALAKGRARTEASGGVTLETIGGIARTGVDSISVGALTHSAPAADLALEVG